MSTIISPSILSADFANLERDIKLVTDNGAQWVHVDVMDGHFVPNITIGIPVVKSLRKVTNAVLDVHLMIDNPEKYAEDFIKAGADVITFHYEATKDAKTLLKKIKSLGVKAGLSIKPKTPAECILDCLEDCDLLLVMTVEPGFGGQSFMQDCAEKVPLIKDKGHKNLIIQVDGGINDKTAKICKDLGANCLVAGSYIYNSNDVKSAIASLK